MMPKLTPNAGASSSTPRPPLPPSHPLAGLLKRSRRDIEANGGAAASSSSESPSNRRRQTNRGALVLLCGLPAAGKSTLAQRLLEVGPAQLRKALPWAAAGVRVWHLSFDAVLAQLEAQRGASGFDPELWHAARARALAAVRAHCALLAGSPPSSPPSPPSPLASLATCAVDGDENNAIDVLVLDDNFHYRSMRKAYYRLARDHRLGLCTLCLPIRVEDAVQRDSLRVGSERVGMETISLMAETLQWPDVAKHPWEQSAYHLETPPEAIDEPKLWAHLCETALSKPVVEEGSSTVMSAEAVGQRAAEVASSQLATAESAVHQLDLRLRKVITNHLSSGAAKALAGPERSALAKRLGERKKEALQACRKSAQPQAEGAAQEEEEQGEELDAAVDALEQQFFALLLRSGAGAGEVVKAPAVAVS